MQNPAPSPLVGEGRGERPPPQSSLMAGEGARPSELPGLRIGSRGASAAGRVLVAATFLVVAVALGMVVFYAPNDRVQGVVQRIFYFHVPMAWVAYLAFAVVAAASVAYLWRRDLRWDALARASAELGVLFTTLVLVTGSLWAKPIWNTWWTWDARLTSTLVLWFIYVGYIMLRAYTPDPDRAARFGAVLGIVGFLDIPIIHFSVQWWRTLHPEAVVARADPQAPAAMIATLLVSLAAMTLVYATLLLYRTALERTRDETRELQHADAHVSSLPEGEGAGWRHA